MRRHILGSVAILICVLAAPAFAGDVTVRLDAGAGFSVKDSAGAIERLRVDEATGNISRNGALFVHTTGTNNTFVGAGAGNPATSGPYGGNSALGANALAANTTGYLNTAVGDSALRANTTGFSNAAIGYGALRFNTTGFALSALGGSSLRNNTTGFHNTSAGYFALYANTSGHHNAAFGDLALRQNTTGHNNTAVGRGALFSNTTAYNNTAVGRQALYSNTTGRNTAFGALALRTTTVSFDNAAFGERALYFNTVGNYNSAFGAGALHQNTTGNYNTGVGISALASNTTGANNIAVGGSALSGSTSGGNNAALGFRALYHNTTGNDNVALGVDTLFYNYSSQRNVAIGHRAGFYHFFGSDNIFIANESDPSGGNGQIKIGTAGTHTATRIAGIRGVTTGVANAIPVLIDSTGQLGTVSSSRAVKKDIRDMGDATARLLALRPVTFRYREQEQTLPSGAAAPSEYGLVAEEVAEVFPELVVYDEAGKPFTVKYHVMAPMLLNEMKRQRRDYEREIAGLRASLARLETRVEGMAR